MGPVIKVKNLSVTLGGKVEALRDVSVELSAGKIVGIIGPSGAGKTTLIRCLVGRLRMTSGSITIFGQEVGSPALRRQVSYMTQELSVYPDLSVQENLTYFASMRGQSKKQARAAVADALDAVELADKAHSLVADLSGGQKQRVSLAVALLGSPKLLALDEPTVGLDPVLREKLWTLFARLARQGVSLVVSSHSMLEAERCEDLVLIRDGEIIAHETPAALLKKTGTTSLEQSFLKLVGGSHEPA
ncbi:MAG TPA: ABC transporter ATP-binding protein [Candidatus Acidoferrum sp.]|nr:ABC transporter ATP-binding protein [Candidatus Acidoferrum sp.]